ncbi:MAG: hypothetical protein ABI199_01875 [Bacteroidia bacterium]
MMKSLEIKPHEGLGTLKFGVGMQEVETLVGCAENIEQFNELDEHRTIVWHYWEQGYSLFFDLDFNNRFSSVEIDNEDTLLWGKKIFQLKEKEIITLFKEKGFTEIETEMHEWGEKRISFDEAIIDFYFEKNKLVAINYGVINELLPIVIFPN